MAQTLTIEPAFAAWLAALPAVVDLAGGRVWPWGAAPQSGDFPYLLYARIGGNRLRSTKGPTTRVSHPKIQIDVVARTVGEAYLLADAVALAIEDTTTGLQGRSLDGHRVQSARCTLPAYRGGMTADASGATAGNPVFGDEVAEPRLTIECTLWFEEG